MKITEKDINEVHEALKCCRDGNSCSKCPYGSEFDCIEIVEHIASELYMSEHPEIFKDKEVEE